MYGGASEKTQARRVRWRWLSGMSMTRVGVTVLAIAASVATWASSAIAEPMGPPHGQDRNSPYMRVFGVTQPPYGFVEFCQRMPEECKQGPQEEQRFSATPERLSELHNINQ